MVSVTRCASPPAVTITKSSVSNGFRALFEKLVVLAPVGEQVKDETKTRNPKPEPETGETGGETGDRRDVPLPIFPRQLFAQQSLPG